MHVLFKASPLGAALPDVDFDAFAPKTTALGTDHAADQYCFGSHWEDFRSNCDRRLRGKKAILSISPINLLPLIAQACDDKITAVGGLDAWNALSDNEREHHDAGTYERIILLLGETEYQALSPEDKRVVNLFIHAGCCMHKEMNSAKGGNSCMMGMWSKAGLVGPIKLMNRDNAAAAAGGSSTAKVRAAEVSGAGGVKATSLAGAIFNHKDDKKGQQDTVQAYMLVKLGYCVPFPDTSNIRYHSHCAAALELIVHLPLYIEFLELVQDKKESGTFNHMEQNLYKALHDIPTLTELAVLALYSLAISTAYMKHVRGDEKANALDLGPYHEKVKAHCKAIINNPDLLLGPAASYTTGNLSGEVWGRPDGFYAIHALIPRLPHLREALVAFFQGALDTWERFTSEFAADGLIASSTAAERARAWIPTTNDVNEGALGDLRVWKRKAPSMTLLHFNSRKMYKRNDTKTFMENLTPEANKFIKQSARLLDSIQLEKQNLVSQGKADQSLGNANKTQRIAKRTKKEATSKALAEKLNALVPNLNVDSLQEATMTVPVIELQLEWHRRLDDKIPKKSTLGNKALKLEALIAAVKRHNQGLAGKSKSSIIEDDAMDLDHMDTEEEMEDEDMNLD